MTGTARAQERAADPTGTWTWTVERKGEKFTSKHSGEPAGDAVTGADETTAGGKEQKKDWEAKRAK